jgi:hypothetical protein
MAKISGEEFRVSSYGFVTEIDDPKGVSWLLFPSLALDDHPRTEDGSFDIVPVSTAELAAAKSSSVGEPEVDDMFIAEINLAAQQQSEVVPTNVEYRPKPSQEDIDAFEAGN